MFDLRHNLSLLQKAILAAKLFGGYRPLNNRMWPANEEDLILVQSDLGSLTPELWDPAGPVHLAAGCFVCYPKKHPGKGIAGDAYWAAAACLRNHQQIAVRVACGHTLAPYRPGLLALREGPILEGVVRLLPELPEVLLVNATGRDHPHRAGLALHLGCRLSLPSIGVTRNPLLAHGDGPEDFPGATAPLKIGQEIVGYWLRTSRGSPPLAVHAGWRTTPEMAVRIVGGLIRRFRTPEPLRHARQAAREARAHLSGHPRGL